MGIRKDTSSSFVLTVTVEKPQNEELQLQQGGQSQPDRRWRQHLLHNGSSKWRIHPPLSDDMLFSRVNVVGEQLVSDPN